VAKVSSPMPSSMRPLVLTALCALASAGCGSDSDSGGSSAPGEDAYRQFACASCHSLDGSEGTGPTFKGLAGSTVTLDGGKRVKATREYLRRAIVDPDAEVAEGYSAGLMKASIDGFDLESKPEDVERLVTFIEGVR
jgi:cytochrome c2